MEAADLLASCDEKGVLRTFPDTPPAHYAVKLDGLSLLLGNNIESYKTAEFEVGGYKWKLIFYPNGKKSRSSYPNGKKPRIAGDNISVYLMVVESSLPQPWSEVHAVFRVFLLDQNKDNYYTLQVANARRFHKMKSEWGFDQFMPLEEFNDPSNGYLVDDTCVFGAEVYVKKTDSCKGERLVMVKNVKTYKHTWKIRNFSSIATEDVHESTSFYTGNHEWKIDLHPKGNGKGTGSHISIFLALVDHTSLPIATRVYAEYTVRIIDQLKAKHHSRKTYSWFTPYPAHAKGWARFISLSDFSASCNGYLVKDKCIIEAEVTVHGVTTSL